MLLELMKENELFETRLGAYRASIKMLLDAGADVDADNPKTGLTPYQYVMTQSDRLNGWVSPFKQSKQSRSRRLLKYQSSLPINRGDMAKQPYNEILHLLDSGRYANVELVVAGQSFRALKEYLAECSFFFHALFDGSMEMKETHASSITIGDIDADLFEVMLTAIYCGGLESDLGGSKDLDPLALLKATRRFGLSFRWTSIFEAISNSLDVVNVFDVLKQAKSSDLRGLIKACRAFVTAHHCEIFQRKGATFDAEEMEELIKALKNAEPYRLAASRTVEGIYLKRAREESFSSEETSSEEDK